jgi:flagellar motor switch protein FliN
MGDGTADRPGDGPEDGPGGGTGAGRDGAGAAAAAGTLPAATESRRTSAVLGVPIEVVISVGRARPLVSELVSLKRDSVLALDSRIEDPVEIYIGNRLIARGELQEMEGEPGRLGVRLTEIEDLSNGV